MGLLGGAFGNNDAYKWLDQNRNGVGGAFAGLIGAKDFGQGAQGVAYGAMNGNQADVVKQDKVKQQQTEAMQRQQAADIIRNQYNRPEVADALIQGGLGLSDAWNNVLTGMNQGPAKPIEVGGMLVDPTTYKPLFNSNDYAAPKTPDAPSGYRQGSDGNLTFIPGGPADPANQGKTTEAQRRNQQLASVIQPELATVNANWDQLAQTGNQAANMIPGIGGSMTSPGYQQAINSLGTIAQSYLYSVSGAAAPAEEVQKLVASVTPQPFDKPETIADKKRRIQQMADAVIQAGGGGQSQAPAPGQQPSTTSSGVQWSVTP